MSDGSHNHYCFDCEENMSGFDMDGKQCVLCGGVNTTYDPEYEHEGATDRSAVDALTVLHQEMGGYE